MSIFFDESYYLNQNPDVLQAIVAGTLVSPVDGVSAARYHFDTWGWQEGRDPNASFDTSFYLAENLDVLNAGINPLDHFINYGAAEGRVPNPTLDSLLGNPPAGGGDDVFDSATYLATNPDVQAAVTAGTITAYQHWVLYGQFESRAGAQTIGGTDLTGGDPDVGTTFTLTTGADAGAGFTGTAKNDTFVATNATLTPGDDLDGSAGTDILKVSTNIGGNTTLAGFATKNIENIEVTADGTAGSVLTFDVTGVNGASALNNVNSSLGLTLQGMTNLVSVGLSNVSGGNTTIIYDAPTVAGTADAQNLSLQNVNSLANAAVSNVTANGIEIFNVDVSGTEASLLTALAGGGAETTLNVTGSQGLTIQGPLGGALNTIDASKFTGPLDVTVAIGQNLSVVTGSGDDIFRTQAGETFNNKDSVDLGAGTDTLFVDDAVAIAGAAGATFSNVEQLGINDGIDGTVDMDKWSGINKIISTGPTGGAGVTSNTTINNIQDDFALDLGGTLGGFNLTLDHKTDTTTNTASLNVNLDAANQALGTVTLTDAETFSIKATDATNNAAVDTLTIGNLIGPDLNGSTLNLAGDANITITAATAANLSKIEGGTATGALNINSLGGANTALTINTGSGNDLITGSTKADTVNAGAGNDTITGTTGADNYTGGDGNDTYVYASGSKAATAALSNNAGGTDTITDFVSGTDVLNLNGLQVNNGAGGTASFLAGVNGGTTTFVGNQATFALAQGALRGANNSDVVFQADQKILWIDTDGNGTLDDNDFRLFLSGTDSVTAADIGINTTGVTFTANTNPAGFSTAVAANSVEGTVTAAGNDTINALTAEINASAAGAVNGNAGTDVLNVTNDAVGLGVGANVVNVETVNLQQGSSGAANFTNAGAIATIANTHATNGSNINIAFGAASTVNVTGGAGNDSVTLDGFAFSGTFNGGGGLDQLNTVNGTSIAGVNAGAATTFAQLNMAAGATNSMTATQHEAFTVINGTGAETILLSGAGNVTGGAQIENYILSSTANTFTVNAAQLGVNLTENGANDQTVNIGSSAITGNYVAFDGGAGGDILVAAAGANITGAQGNGGGAGSALGFGVLNLTGNLTATALQHNGFTTINGTGTNTVTLAGAGAVTGANSIETYNLGNTGRTFNLGANLAQNVNEDVNGQTHTLDFATGVFTGNVTGLDAADDIIQVSNGTNIAGVNSGASLIANNLTFDANAAVTLTQAQYDVFNGGTITAGGATESVIITTTTTTSTNDAAIEGYTLSSTGNDVFQFDLADAGATAFTANIAAGGNDRLILDNATIEAAATEVVTVTGFTAGAGGDLISSHVGGASIVTGAYTTADAGNKITGQVGGNVIEIHSLGANGVSIAAPTNDASVLAALNSVLTGGGVVGDIANGNYTVLGYNGNDAYVYQVTIAGGDGTGGADDLVELVGTLTGVGADSLTAANISAL